MERRDRWRNLCATLFLFHQNVLLHYTRVTTVLADAISSVVLFCYTWDITASPWCAATARKTPVSHCMLTRWLSWTFVHSSTTAEICHRGWPRICGGEGSTISLTFYRNSVICLLNAFLLVTIVKSSSTWLDAHSFYLGPHLDKRLGRLRFPLRPPKRTHLLCTRLDIPHWSVSHGNCVPSVRRPVHRKLQQSISEANMLAIFLRRRH